MEKWLIKSASADLSDLGKNPREKILYRIIANRGISTKEELVEYLNPTLDGLNSPELLKDMDKAGSILVDAIENKLNIRIIGDYDVDGIMSSFILYKFIKKYTDKVDYVLPHRVEDGYGLTVDLVNDASSDEIDLIITCDNGISAFDSVDRAHELGIKVLITDHHEPLIVDGEEILPKAAAVVNPKRSDCPYPYKNLAGAAVAYKLVEYTGMILGEDQGAIVREFLEFVAIATVCDVMELVGENRVIVVNGLQLLNNTTNIGLKALINTVEIGDVEIKGYHLGFILGPVFNAAGRIDSATMGLELLLEDNPSRAMAKAKKMSELNRDRISITEDGLESVLGIIEKEGYYKEDIIVVYDESIHESVAGIIAGRIKDIYYKPTIVLTCSKGMAKGSGRSINEYNMISEIQNQKDLLEMFGGHRLAAGMSLKIENIDKFRERLNDSSDLTEEDLIPKRMIDLGIPIDLIDMEFIEDLSKLEPFGVANPSPTFGAKDIEIFNMKLIGKKSNVLRMDLGYNNYLGQGIMFRGIDDLKEELNNNDKSLEDMINSGESFVADIVYTPQINEWRGNKNIQYKIDSIRVRR